MPTDSMAETRRKEQAAKLTALDTILKALQSLDSQTVTDVLAATVRVFGIDRDEL